MKKLKVKILLASVSLTALGVFIFTVLHFTGLNWREGAKQMYNFKITMKVSSTNHLSGMGGSTGYTVSGVLNFRVLKADGDRVRAGVQFSDLKVINSGYENSGMEKLYSILFLVDFDRSGRVLQWHFPNTISAYDEKLVGNIINGFQVNAGGLHAGGWSSEETDGTGDFIARYSMKDRSIVKSKKSYSTFTQVTGQKLDDFHIIVRHSNIVIQPSEDLSWLESVSGREKIVVSNKGSRALEIRISKESMLKIIPFAPDKNLAIWAEGITCDDFMALFLQGEKNRESYLQAVRMDMLKKKYAGKKLSYFLSRIFSGKDMDYDAVWALSEYLLVHPEKSAKIADIIRSGRSKNKMSDLMYALKLCGTIQAQTALCDLATDPVIGKKSRIMAMISLSNLQFPSSVTVETLLAMASDSDSLSDEIAASSLITLGTVDHRLIGQGSELKDRVRDEMKSMMKKSSDNEKDVMVILSAMGNAGDPEFISDIVPYLDSQNTGLRKSAVAALRNMNDDESMGILMDSLENDSDPNVREEAVRGISQRNVTESSVSLVSDAVLREKDQSARYAMLKYLAENRKAYPSAAKTLRASLDNGLSDNEKIFVYKKLYTKVNEVN